METNAAVTAGSGGSRSFPLGPSLVLSCSCLLRLSHPVWVAREAPPARQPARSTAPSPHSVCFWTFPLSPPSSACCATVCLGMNDSPWGLSGRAGAGCPLFYVLLYWCCIVLQVSRVGCPCLLLSLLCVLSKEEREWGGSCQRRGKEEVDTSVGSSALGDREGGREGGERSLLCSATSWWDRGPDGEGAWASLSPGCPG